MYPCRSRARNCQMVILWSFKQMDTLLRTRSRPQTDTMPKTTTLTITTAPNAQPSDSEPKIRRRHPARKSPSQNLHRGSRPPLMGLHLSLRAAAASQGALIYFRWNCSLKAKSAQLEDLLEDRPRLLRRRNDCHRRGHHEQPQQPLSRDKSENRPSHNLLRTPRPEHQQKDKPQRREL